MKLTNKAFVLTAIFAASVSLFYACSKSATPATRVSASSANNMDIEPTGMCGNADVTPLTAGQTIPAGTLTIENDADNVYVTYKTSDDWKLQELHLSVDVNTNGDCTQSKSSDIAPGKFPYKMVFNAGPDGPCGTNSGFPTSYTFVIPRATLGASSCFCYLPARCCCKMQWWFCSRNTNSMGWLC
jgi:hypothetical protein